MFAAFLFWILKPPFLVRERRLFLLLATESTEATERIKNISEVPVNSAVKNVVQFHSRGSLCVCLNRANIQVCPCKML